MNSLLAQFLAEARALMDAAAQGLLQMERGEGGLDVVNAVFRAVHTLKSKSGPFGIAPLTSMLQAAEDVLDTVRTGRLAVHAGLVDQLRATIDQTRIWIDDLERTVDLPPEAAGVSAKRAAALRAALAAVGRDEATAAPAGPPAWVAALNPAHRSAAEQAARDAGRDLVAIAYTPDTDCFLRGEDPLQRIGQVPDLILLDMVQPSPGPAAEAFDPFVCALSFRLLSTAPIEDLRRLFRDSPATEIIAFAPAPRAMPYWDVVAEVVTAQRHLLAADSAPGQKFGRAASVAELLRRIARHCGEALPKQERWAEAVAEAGAGEPSALLALVAAVGVAFAKPREAERDGPDPAIAAAGLRPPAPPALRVDQARIDELMSLIGELIVAKNRVSYLDRRAEAGMGARELAHGIEDQRRP